VNWSIGAGGGAKKKEGRIPLGAELTKSEIKLQVQTAVGGYVNRPLQALLVAGG